MTPDMSRLKIEIDRDKSIKSFVVSNDEELKEAFKWKNTQSLIQKKFISTKEVTLTSSIVDHSL